MMDKKGTQALEEGGVFDRLVNGLSLMTGGDKERMMQIYEAAIPEDQRK